MASAGWRRLLGYPVSDFPGVTWHDDSYPYNLSSHEPRLWVPTCLRLDAPGFTGEFEFAASSLLEVLGQTPQARFAKRRTKNAARAQAEAEASYCDDDDDD